MSRAKVTCPVCNTETEYKQFNQFSYWYCPTCKEDIEKLSVPQKSEWKAYDYRVGE